MSANLGDILNDDDLELICVSQSGEVLLDELGFARTAHRPAHSVPALEEAAHDPHRDVAIRARYEYFVALFDGWHCI